MQTYSAFPNVHHELSSYLDVKLNIEIDKLFPTSVLPYACAPSSSRRVLLIVFAADPTN